ncbi:Uu.00g121740.m01.CDS01 [Anthostomella pinea]|uniref:Uu.00g121740.m01.CDS01 n=1 Tax=Anthostomella pinea TaxID=933095 RepID=A0AAI8VI14_9PEZI|nr:Uu.00g121740.m01.CDS01 [Anthostomella pinea]
MKALSATLIALAFAALSVSARVTGEPGSAAAAAPAIKRYSSQLEAAALPKQKRGLHPSRSSIRNLFKWKECDTSKQCSYASDCSLTFSKCTTCNGRWIKDSDSHPDRNIETFTGHCA